ncbi:glycosyltransferase [Shimia sp. R9_2]|uniref:glycosyltransferase n=1 Tax=Shimia sp. R9_2 TaxID=2821112 RepID=UPI001ADA312B|nr:glycosyltransferase [Shimia sp. R9_2]MBO9397628.1 glycosyltransferase [Shimia sp. R9_2]
MLMRSPARNIALVHDWFPGLAGGEYVTAELARAFPGAPIHTLFDFLTEEERDYATNGGLSPLKVSRLNRLPGVQKYYRYLLLQCAREIEKFDMRGFDCVISSSAAFSKGVITGVDQPHIAYIHSPPRYAWDLAPEYLDSLGGGFLGQLKRHLAHGMLHKFRLWDLRTVNMVDHIVANSEFIAKRIEKVYRRKAQVIHPPIDMERFPYNEGARDDYFVTASRFVPYKRIDLIVETFTRRPDLKLKVVGTGPEQSRIMALAGPNVEFTGRLADADMAKCFRNARAFLFAALEDFGMVPVEAQACGTPVIAFGVGGSAETVRGLDKGDPTGVLYNEQSIPSLLGAVDQFLAVEDDIKPKAVRRHAESFRKEVFQKKMQQLVEEIM